MGLFKFEIKKIISSKKVIILWIIGIILVCLYAFMSDRLDNSIKSTKINIYQNVIEDLNISITSLENRIRIEKKPLTKEGMEKSLEESKAILKLNEEIKQGIIENNSRKEIEGNLGILQSQRRGMVSGELVIATPLKEIDIEIEKYKYLNENNLKPINDGMDMNGINFINLVLKYMAPMLLGIIIILSTADIVSKEVDYGTIQILLFQKVDKRKIILSKLISCILVNIAFFLIVLLGLAVFLSFKNGVGNINYPNIVDVGGVLKIYTVGELILENLIIIIFYVIFLSCFSTLVSILSRNSVESLSIATTICIGSAILFNNITLPQWLKNINPFNYLAGNEILKTGFSSSSITLANNTLTIVLSFIIYSIIIVLVSLYMFNRKQFEIES